MLTTCYRREPCADIREGISEVSVAVRTAAMMEPRKTSRSECRDCPLGRRQHRLHRYGKVQTSSAVSDELKDVRTPCIGTWKGFARPCKSLTRSLKLRRYSVIEDE